MAQRVFLVRHGETEWSKALRHTGRTDVELTEEGRRQAELLATRLAGEAFELVLTSPLRRARDTCRIAGLAERAEVDPDLLEWDYGEFEGLTTQQIRAGGRPDWDVWDAPLPGGEDVSDVGARADRVIERLDAVAGDAAVFAHGHLLRVLAARWAGLPPAGGARLALATATLCVLGAERETKVIERWNDDAHLRPRAAG